TCLLFTDPTTTPIYPLSLHDALPIFLHPCRVEHGHHCVDQREFALVRNGGRFRGMIIAHQDEHAAQPGRPRGVAVTESIARTVRSEEHTSELQSRENLVCRLLLEKKK